MANAVYRSSSSTRKGREHERPRGNTRLTSVESEARALLLARQAEAQGQHDASEAPPSLASPDVPQEVPNVIPESPQAPAAKEAPEEPAAPARPKSGIDAEKEKAPPRPRTKEGKQSERRKENSPHAETSRGWPLHLTPSLVLMFVVFELVTLSFFFLFGLVIGKGTVPPPPQAELERILPTEENRAEQAQEILPQEELRFMANLKTDEPSDSREQTATPPASGHSEPQKNESSVLEDDSNLYDFVIRVAAFKNEEQADALRARLEGAGMRTRLLREKAQKGTWHFVQVLFRGTEVKMNQMRQGLPAFGLRDSIVTSKTPISQR